MRVLYIHPVAVFGGATKSLCELLSAMPVGAVQGFAIAPRGDGSQALLKVGVAVRGVRGISQWDNTLYSHYRAWRWLVLLREFAFLPGTVAALFKCRDQGPYTLIHCNEITTFPVGILAKRILACPLVVHVRSVQRAEESGPVTRMLMHALRRHADAVIAIDSAVRRSLPLDVPVELIHNGLRVPHEATVSAGSMTKSRCFTVGIIGVLIRAKGVMELLHSVKILKDRGVSIRLLVAGENPRKLKGLTGWILKTLNLSQDVRSELEEFVRIHHLEDAVELLGFVGDIGAFYRKIDLLCFPSHLDAPGRPVFEAALHGIPALVAMKEPTTDVVEHEVTGLCIPDPNPAQIADAIARLASSPEETRKMGALAYAKALSTFDISVSARKLLSLYEKVSRITLR